MKRKPILLKKMIREQKGKRREVIGLIGTHHGVGVTHTGLMLAFCLGEELGKKTALVECNHHHDFSLIQNAYEWNREDKNSFSFHQITCYKDLPIESLGKIFGDDYECIIIDFGTDFTIIREEFIRCGIKIVVGGRSEWDRQKLIHFAAASKEIQGSSTWLYFIPQANNQTLSKVKDEVRGRVYAVPLSEEPTRPSHKTTQLFNELL